MGGADRQELGTDAARKAAAQIYVQVFPLLLADMVRRAHPMAHGQLRLLRGDAAVFAPGLDGEDERLVAASAWIDLSEGAQVLRIPDMRRRFFALTLIDSAGESFASFGSRSGGDQGVDVALVGPHWRGEAPAGVLALRAPSDGVWALLRIYADGVLDRPEAEALAGGFAIGPLDAAAWRRSAVAADMEPPTAPVLRQALETPPSVLFHRLDALVHRAPAASQPALLARLTPLRAELGGPPSAFGWSAELAAAIEAGVADAIAQIREAAVRHEAVGSGWRIVTWPDAGVLDPLERAARAYAQIGALARQDLLTFQTDLDATGRAISGSNAYRLRFENGQLPPVRGYWRLSASPPAAHGPGPGVSSRSELVLDPDGALELLIQPEPPALAQIPNWLPAPSGCFSLVMRLHWPSPPESGAPWRPPPVQRVDTAADSSAAGWDPPERRARTPLPDRETASILWSNLP